MWLGLQLGGGGQRPRTALWPLSWFWGPPGGPLGEDYILLEAVTFSP